MRCARCGVALVRGEEFLRLAVLCGDPPGPLRWGRDCAWPSLVLCVRCGRAVGTLMGSPPIHKPAGSPLPAEQLERLLGGVPVPEPAAGPAEAIPRPRSIPRGVRIANGG